MYEYSCTVDRVVDGDTCDVVLDLGFDILYRCRVRLYGIDTPESRTRDADEKIRDIIVKIVPEFKPQTSIVDLIHK